MGKAILIFALGSIALFTIINLNMSQSAGSTAKGSFDLFKEVHAKNIANSVALMLVSQLGDSNEYRATSVNTIDDVLWGSADYRVIDTTVASVSLIKIDVNGYYEGMSKRVVSLVSIPNGGFFPPTVKAAISTNNPVSASGTLVVDGRDHDINGNLIPNSGTLGIWSTRPITQSGSAKIGGTEAEDNEDEVPAKPADSEILGANQSYPGGYPNTPDSALGGTAKGFPPGTLKAIAQSGYKGSQYTTNPAFLSYPFRGVTYVELPSGGVWTAANIEGSGILVIHNSYCNAVIKNENLGTFKGLIIADDIVHLHTTVLGAIIALTSSPSEGNCIGNGSGDALFSRQAIISGIGQVVKANRFGFGKQRIAIHRWYE
jgi:hypothetical protein